MKLVIVEDEEIIRTGLVGSIDWRSLGIEVVGQAGDGDQAEALIERTRPDIVVSDVRIPFVDGLTLAERVTARYPGTAIVIISGFDDFGYAQKAIRIGVEDYVLKPIDLDNFTEVLRKVCGKLEKRGRERREIEDLRTDAANSQLIVRERLLRDLVAGRLPEAEAPRRLPELFVPMSWFGVMHIEIDVDARPEPRGGGEDRRALELSVEETLHALTSRGMFLLEEAGAEFSLGTAERQKELLHRVLSSAERNIRRRCALLPRASVTIGIGAVHQGAVGLKASYQEAARACACRYILGPGRTIDYAEVLRLTGEHPAVPLFSDSELLWAVRLGDRCGIHDNLARLLAELSRAGEQAERRLQMYVAGIFLSSLDAVRDEGGSVDEVFGDPLAVYNAVLSEHTAARALEVLEEALGEIAECLENDRSVGHRHVIEKAKRYIRRNFGRSELGLEEVAEFVRLSPGYLSSIFSGAEGHSFSDYLSQLRMERAKELLRRSSSLAGEIADMVGFSTPAYFSSAFKKYAGCSPGEFRRTARDEASGR